MVKCVTNVVFDLGGVLIDWNPDYLYRKLIPGDEERQFFLTQICSPSWNEKQDMGRSFSEGEAELIARFPDKKDLIRAWRLRYDETIKGPIDGSVALLSRLYEAQVPLYALTNWSAETFPIARKRFAFLNYFKDIVISGVEKTAKPQHRIYEILLSRNRLDPQRTLFIDDRVQNVEAAITLGLHAHQFSSSENLKTELIRYGFPPLERNDHGSTSSR